MVNHAYDADFDAAGRLYNVDPQLTKTVFHLESSGNPNTRDSVQGAQGGMGLLPATAGAMGASNPRDIKQAIPAATRYLAEGLNAEGTPEGALAYYHGGPDHAQWGAKTAAYVARGQRLYPQMALTADAPQPAPGDKPVAAAPKADDDLIGAYLKGAKTAAPQAAPAAAPEGDSGPDLLSAYSAADKPAIAQATNDNANSVGPTRIPAINNFWAGAKHGVQSVVDTGARLAARVDAAVPALDRLDRYYGLDPQAQVAAQPAANALYDQKYGNSGWAGAGDLAGKTAATLPLIMSGSGLVGAAGGALGEGIAAAAPWAGRAIQAGTDLLTGSAAAPGAGLIGRGLARGAGLMVNGGLTGAGVAALTGDDVQSGAEAGAVGGPVMGAVGGVLGGAARLTGRAASGAYNALTGRGIQTEIDNALAPGRAVIAAPPVTAAPTIEATLPAAAEPAVVAPVAAAPVAAASAPSTPSFLNSSWLKNAGEVGGSYDANKGAQALVGEVQAALSAGHPVSLMVDGGRREVPITGIANGMMQDATGQRWGTLPLATDGTGKEGVRIGGAAPATAAPAVTATSAPAAATAPTAATAAAPSRAAEMQRLTATHPSGWNDKVYVEGVNPTEAEHAGNSNTSRAQAVIYDRNPEPFDKLQEANTEARIKHANNLAGDADSLAELEATRRANATRNLEPVWANKQAVDAQPALDSVKSVLKGPDGKLDPVRDAMQKVADALHGPDGKLETDPEMLYGARRQISFMLSKKGQLANPAYGDETVIGHLRDAQKAIDAVIEPKNPGYQKYLTDYTADSRPIDTQELLQGYMPKIATQSGMTYDGVQNMLRQIVTKRQADGINPAKSIDPDTMEGLFNLRDDLARKRFIDRGKSRGSGTNQNEAFADAAGVGAAHLAAAHFPLGNALLESRLATVKGQNLAKWTDRLTNPPPNALIPTMTIRPSPPSSP